MQQQLKALQLTHNQHPRLQCRHQISCRFTSQLTVTEGNLDLQGIKTASSKQQARVSSCWQQA